MSDGPSAEQMGQIAASDNPIVAMFQMMPDDQLEALAEAVAAELGRRGLRDD